MMSALQEIPEFHDVHRGADGMWTAVHHSGRTIEAPTFELLDRVEAPIARILHTHRVSGLSA